MVNAEAEGKEPPSWHLRLTFKDNDNRLEAYLYGSYVIIREFRPDGTYTTGEVKDFDWYYWLGFDDESTYDKVTNEKIKTYEIVYESPNYKKTVQENIAS
jgi:hypothetical protein